MLCQWTQLYQARERNHQHISQRRQLLLKNALLIGKTSDQLYKEEIAYYNCDLFVAKKRQLYEEKNYKEEIDHDY